jgi:hypothetical protein
MILLSASNSASQLCSMGVGSAGCTDSGRNTNTMAAGQGVSRQAAVQTLGQISYCCAGAACLLQQCKDMLATSNAAAAAAASHACQQDATHICLCSNQLLGHSPLWHVDVALVKVLLAWQVTEIVVPRGTGACKGLQGMVQTCKCDTAQRHKHTFAVMCFR